MALNSALALLNSSDENKRILRTLYQRRKVLLSNILVYQESRMPGSDEKVIELNGFLKDINDQIDDVQVEVNKSMVVDDDLNTVLSKVAATIEESKEVTVITAVQKVSEFIDGKIQKSNFVQKAIDEKVEEEVDKANVDDILEKLNNKDETRSQGKQAAKRQKEAKGVIGRQLVKFKNSVLFKFKPFKTRGSIQANNDALYTEREYWNDRITKFQNKLIVFSIRGSRQAEIKNAEKNIEQIDKLLEENKKRLLKLSAGMISKIKNVAYRVTGAQSKEDDKEIADEVKKIIPGLTDDIKKRSQILNGAKKLKDYLSNDTDNDQEDLNEIDGVDTSAALSSTLSKLSPFENEEVKTSSEESSEEGGVSTKIQAISSVYTRRSEDPVKVSSIIVTQNEKIIQLLSDISEDMIDEQDTAMKASESTLVEEPTQEIQQVADKKPEKSFLAKLLGGLMMLLGPVFKLLRKLNGSNVLKFLWKALKFGGTVIGFLAKNIWKALKSTYKLGSWVAKQIGAWVKKFLPGIKSIVGKVSKFMANIGTTIAKAAKAAVNKALEFAKPALTWLIKQKDALKTLLGLGKEGTKAAAKGAVKGAANGVKGATKVSEMAPKKGGFFSGFADKVSAAKDKLSKLKDSAIKKVSAVKDKVVKGGKALYKAGKTKVIKASKAVMSVVKKGIGKAIKFGKGTVAALKGKALELAKGKILPMIGKVLGKNGLKILTKTLSIIPGVSILTGLGFGIYEAMQGNYKKAALEVVAGLIGSIPVVGPALGIATSIIGGNMIDSANAAAQGESDPARDQQLSDLESSLQSTDDPLMDGVVNKQKKINEKSLVMTDIVQNTAKKEQMQRVPVPAANGNTNINNVNMTQPQVEGVSISEAFPTKYN